MGRFTRPAFLSAIAISTVLAFAGTGHTQSPNPHVGTWKGNPAKSKAATGTAIQTATTRIEAAGEGVHVVADTTYATGPNGTGSSPRTTTARTRRSPAMVRTVTPWR